MDSVELRVVVAGVAASFALGFAAAWYLKPAPDVAPASGQTAEAAPAGQVAWPVQAGAVGAAPGQAHGVKPLALPDNASVDELLARALLPADRQQQGYAAEDRLRQLIQSDPTALRKLLLRYDSARAPQERELLKSLLSTVQTPEVIAFSTRLAGSLDAAERKAGFDMLQSLAPDAPATRELVKRTLATEQSPEVLVQALATLTSAAAEPDETSAIVAQLGRLAQHPDPAVRSASITQLGRWDKTGEGAGRLAQALADPSPEVRQAAVFAIAQTGARSESLKSALLALVSNPQETRDVRGSALQVLERFSLSKEEYAVFTQARARLNGH